MAERHLEIENSTLKNSKLIKDDWDVKNFLSLKRFHKKSLFDRIQQCSAAMISCMTTSSTHWRWKCRWNIRKFIWWFVWWTFQWRSEWSIDLLLTLRIAYDRTHWNWWSRWNLVMRWSLKICRVLSWWSWLLQNWCNCWTLWLIRLDSSSLDASCSTYTSTSRSVCTSTYTSTSCTTPRSAHTFAPASCTTSSLDILLTVATSRLSSWNWTRCNVIFQLFFSIQSLPWCTASSQQFTCIHSTVLNSKVSQVEQIGIASANTTIASTLRLWTLWLSSMRSWLTLCRRCCWVCRTIAIHCVWKI